MLKEQLDEGWMIRGTCEAMSGIGGTRRCSWGTVSGSYTTISGSGETISGSGETESCSWLAVSGCCGTARADC
ncbi:MAG: hypothetical protein H6603_10825 [Flavobacteriales bacterium]|nr:hypothetical protein [Flavobacteriales bacterium]MCB9205460.1 hypothetical protein [Flavobacteriales bacterium]